jgi:hypothetical protein
LVTSPVGFQSQVPKSRNSEVKKLLSGILPKTNAEKLVASTGGSDSPTNPLRNFEKAKFASKTHGLITSYAANTHQGI